MEGDRNMAKISRAGSRARSSPSKQPLRLSIEETCGRGVQEHVSIEESCSYDLFKTSVIDGLFEPSYDIHEGKVPLKLKTDEPQYPVSVKLIDDVDPQESTISGPEPEAGSCKTLSHEEEAQLGTVDDGPTGETPIIRVEIINNQLGGMADPCEMRSPDVPSGDLQEKKKKRKRRRKSVKKTVEQFFYKSSLELRSKLMRVRQLSPKMFSGLKTFGTTNLFEVVRGGFRNLFQSCALGGRERGAIFILLFLIIFHSTSGLKNCEHMFNSTTPIDCPITLLNLKDQLQPTCNLKEILRCPGRTKCLNNISLCLWNNNSIIFYFFEENTGTYGLEYGLETDNQKIVHLVNKGCKEHSTTTVQPSRRDPHHNAPTVNPGVIAVCVIAALAVLVAVGIIWWCHRRKQEKKKSMERAPTEASLLDSAKSSRNSVI
ncbi:uncharacterized protein LOC144770662 [Lissotriton helveticus]